MNVQYTMISKFVMKIHIVLFYFSPNNILTYYIVYSVWAKKLFNYPFKT